MEKENNSVGKPIKPQGSVNAPQKRKPRKPAGETPAVILAKGNIKLRFTAIIFLGSIILVLALSGGIAFIVNNQNFKDLWLTIGPTIGAVSGAIVTAIGIDSKKKQE